MTPFPIALKRPMNASLIPSMMVVPTFPMNASPFSIWKIMKTRKIFGRNIFQQVDCKICECISISRKNAFLDIISKLDFTKK